MLVVLSQGWRSSDTWHSVRYLEAIQNSQLLAVGAVFSHHSNSHVHCPLLGAIDPAHQAKGSADGPVDVQQGEPSLPLGLAYQQLPVEAFGLRRDSQCQRAGVQASQQYLLLVETEWRQNGSLGDAGVFWFVGVGRPPPFSPPGANASAT